MDNNNNNNFSTPKQPTINPTTGGQLRSRSNSSPSTSSISTPRNGSTTATTSSSSSSITNSIGKGSLVFSTMENAKKTLNMDSSSTPMSQSSKKRLSMNSSLLPPSSIPLPPSQQLSAKKDPSKRHSSFISTTTTTSLGSRPSTPQPNHTTTSTNNNINNGNNVTSTNISSMLESNNSEILSQNQKVTLSTSSNTAFSVPSSTNNGNNPLSNSGGGGNGNHHLVNSNSSTSTPSPTMFISTTSPPPELSLMEGFNQHNLTTTTTTTTTTTNNTLNTSNGINSNSLSPSSHLNNGNNNHLNLNNRSSSPSPTPSSSSSISGRRTPIQNFNSVGGGGVNITSKTQPLFSDREESIQAVCRFRPETAAEQTLGPSEKQLTIGTDQTTIHITPTSSSSSSMAQAFRFSKVYQPNTTQESFYNEVGKPLIDNIVNGYNVGIIAYGQTGAGKTFSLGFSGGEGNDSYNSYCNRSEFYNNSHYLYGGQQQQHHQHQQQQQLPSSWGIMPRIIKDLFIKQDEQQSMNTPQRIKFTTKISYLEVYKEKVYDLLSEGGVNDIEIRMADGGFVVPDAVQSPIQTFTDFLTHLQHIEKNRKIAETKKNMASSRSHAIFIVSLLKEDLENKMTVTSLLYLVDLAGSESASKIDGTTSKIEETKSINKSLYALGGVIEDMSKNSKHVRYRDSKLTQLLQQCFGGNSKTCLIVNCSSSNHESVIRETIQSLNFGQRAQFVKNKPLQNVEESHSELKAKLRELNKEIETYKKFIEKNSNNSGVIPPSSVIAHITQLQNACEELRKKNDRLQEDIFNLEEENLDKDDLLKQFNDFLVLNKNNVSQIEILTQELELSKQINQEQLLNIEQYSQKYQATKEEIQKSFNHRQQLVNDLHDSNEKSKQLELKLKDALLNSKSESDEIRLKLTKALEESTDKDQRINTLESNKQKWKSKCNEVLRQSKELQDRLNILQSTYSNSIDSLSNLSNSSNSLNNSNGNNNNDESLEEIKKLKLNISSLTNQHIEREKSLQKEIDLARSKHTEQTLILKNLKTQIDTLTNKLEIQFPTIVNNNQQQQQQQSSSSSSIESNLIISMNTIEALFEKICKNQEQTNTIISTNVESIMGKLVEIDENEEFIRKEKDRERERAENLKNTLEDAQSNFLKQQEEIKQFIETQLKNKNNINNNNIKNNNNNKLKSKKVGSSNSSSNSNIGSICINILFFLIILVILFFLMVAVGLTIQNQDYNSQYRSSYFFKTT
ncbi:hypothetical protein ACTFIW_005334 [Dictyostelium discoideum]